MEQKDFKLLVDTAQSRLEYLTNINDWCNGYIDNADKAQIDSVKIDSETLIAVRALKDRIVSEILKDARMIARCNLVGEVTWLNVPNLS